MLCLCPLLAKAATESDVVSTSWPINHFMVENEPILLDHASNAYRLNIPVSDRVAPEGLKLDLAFENSNRLNTERSQLVVFVNDYPVGQVALDDQRTRRQASISVAGEYLVNGYNSLTFKVAQHYTDTQCEDWSAPELWTRIDSVRSRLTLNYRKKPVDTSLAALDELINDRLDEYSVSFLRPTREVSDDYLYWGAVVAQGVKLRLDYVPMTLEENYVQPYLWPEEQAEGKRFNISPTLLQHDAVLIGTRAELRELVSTEILATVEGAYLGLFAQDRNPQNFILVISGVNAEQVGLAAKAFSLLRTPFPDAAFTLIRQQDLPAGDGVVPVQTVLPERAYAFSGFGFNSRVLDSEHNSVKLRFSLPADIYSTEEALVTLHLNLAYGAAMRHDSVVNLSLNGLFHHAIWLKESEGAHYRDYRIAIPLRDFKAGLNTLTFEAVLTPSEYGECAFIQRKHLKVTLYDDSIIELPAAGRAATLPDLSLLGTTGYPFVAGGSAGQTAVRLLDSSSDTIRSGWHLTANLAALAHTPLLDLRISKDNDPADRKFRIYLGSGVPPEDILNNAPVQLGRLSRFPYPYREQQRQAETPLINRLLAVLFGEEIVPKATASFPANAITTQSAGLGGRYLLMSYPATDVDEGLVLTVLGGTKNALYPGVKTLVSGDVWGQLQKNLFIWNKRKQVYAQWEGDRFVMGDRQALNLNMIKHFSDHPWQWLVIIGLSLLVTAWVLHRLLLIFKRHMHPRVEEDVE